MHFQLLFVQMIGEGPQWTQGINQEIQEALPLLNRDLARQVAHGIHVVTGALQGLHQMVAFQDLFILHNSSGDLTKEDLLQGVPKVRKIALNITIFVAKFSAF